MLLTAHWLAFLCSQLGTVTVGHLVGILFETIIFNEYQDVGIEEPFGYRM